MEGASHDTESVCVPLTGWSNSGGPCVVLTFDSFLADQDKKPLLVSSVAGTMELASEISLTFRGRPLRVWRYGRPNVQALAHGKRTVHLFAGGGSGPQATDLREAMGGEQWHAGTDDGACLLQLDIPSFGTDALADAWHVTRAQVALPMHELLRHLMPSLYPRWPIHGPAATAAAAASAAPSTAPSEGGEGGDELGGGELELTFYSTTGQMLASGRCACRLCASAVAMEQRRVGVIGVTAEPMEPALRLQLHRSAVPTAAPPPFAPRAGILSVVLRQRRHVVAAACFHFTGAVRGLTAPLWLGEAVYEDESGVTQREPMNGRLSYAELRVIGSAAAASGIAGMPGASPNSVDADMDADMGTAIGRCVGKSGDGDMDRGVVGQDAAGDGRLEGACWEVHGIQLSLLVPAREMDGVTFRPHACGLEWAKSLRRLQTASASSQSAATS